MDTREIIKILKKDGIGVMPTDTLYGLVGSAFSKEAVKKIYKLKGRDDKKPLIILISSLKDLQKFDVQENPILEKVWPGKVSVILPCKNKEFKYLHRGSNSLAFRLPNKKSLIEIIKKTGPLVAPSANPQGLEPAKNIKEAKEYFGDKADFCLAGGTLKSKPSTLIKILARQSRGGNERGEIEVLRGILKKYE